MPSERFDRALSDLDAADRALLDLSLNRGFSDAWIADLLGENDEGAIVRLRERALDAIAGAAGISGPDARSRLEVELKSATSEQWLGRSDPRTRTKTRARRRVIGWPLVIGLAAIVILVAVVVGDTGYEPSVDQAAESPAQPSASEPPSTAVAPAGSDPQSEPVAAPVELAPLPGAPRQGRVLARARRSDGATRVTVILRGLPRPRGRYGLWLYDSLIDSVALGQSGRGTAQINARLPANASRYSFLDLSRQRGRSLIPRHSGISLFRVPLQRLLER